MMRINLISLALLAVILVALVWLHIWLHNHTDIGSV